jgi:hypothetical protein
MNRAAVIEQLKQTQDTLARLLALLEAGGGLTSSPRTFTGPAGNTDGLRSDPTRATRLIERTVLSTYQVAQSLGFRGDFRTWEHLPRIHE